MHWHDYPAILDRSHFAVVERPGNPLAGLRGRRQAPAGRMREPGEAATSGTGTGCTAVWLVAAQTRDVSSSSIRRRLAAAQPTGDLLPDAVAAYIVRHRLYGAAARGKLLA